MGKNVFCFECWFLHTPRKISAVSCSDYVYLNGFLDVNLFGDMCQGSLMVSLRVISQRVHSWYHSGLSLRRFTHGITQGYLSGFTLGNTQGYLSGFHDMVTLRVISQSQEYLEVCSTDFRFGNNMFSNSFPHKACILKPMSYKTPGASQ